MQAGLVQGDQVPEEYVALVQPHVDSYDFFIGEGLQLVVDSLEPVEVSETILGLAQLACRLTRDTA